MTPNTVLLVEDNPSDVFIIQRTFRKLKVNISIEVVSDGDEAIAYLAGAGKYADREQHPLPTLILLDLKLPRRSGFEVLDWLKQQPLLARLPVVVLTSSRQTPDVNRAYDCGANSYLVKSVDPQETEELGRIIQRYWLDINQKPEISQAV
jgi:CheY-like chemotaxis protein